MIRYWTADTHHNHPNICVYTKRPWLKPSMLNPDGTWVSQEAANACAEKNTEVLLQKANARVKQEDTVICVGDYLNRGNEKGVRGLNVKPSDILSRSNGNWIMVSGNHDDNNGVKSVCDFMTVQIGRYRVGVQHIPLLDERIFNQWNALSDEEKKKSNYRNNMLPKQRERAFIHADYCRQMFNFMICGHVHNKWQVKMIAGLWHVNVGVDANRFMPISDSEVLVLVEKAIRSGKGF